MVLTLLIFLNFKERGRHAAHTHSLETLLSVCCLSCQPLGSGHTGGCGQRGRSYVCLTPDMPARSARVQGSVRVVGGTGQSHHQPM